MRLFPHILRLAVLTTLCAITAVSFGSGGTPARADGPSPAPTSLAADGPTTKYGKEVTALRTRVSRTYRASNGSFVDAISAASVNYKDSSGSWQPIDNSLTTDSSGGAHVNKANRYTATLPNDLASAPVRVDFGSSWVTQQLEGASATGSVDGATETYADALPSTSVAYTAGPDQLTELLKLDSLAAPKTFTFDFKASPGTTVQKNKQGQIVLTDSSGRVSFVVPAPVMTDAAGATSGAIAMSVQPSSGGATVSLTPDRAWLGSSERTFPVTVDPSVTLGNDDADCYINSGTPNTSYCGVGTNLDVGYDGSSTSRSLLYFNLAAAAFPSNGIVLDANLQLYLQSTLNSTPAQLSLFKATTNWVTPPGVPQNTTWNTAQQTTSWTTPGGDMGAGSVNTAPTTVSTAGQSYNWRFTQLVQRWLDGQDPNYGVFLKGDPEGTTNVFHFSSNGDINNMPQLLVTYEYAIGDRALYTYDRQSIDDRLGTAVNLGTGNLMLSANDLHIAGTGPDEYIGRFFNSLGSGFDTNGSGDFNYQWQMGTGNDVYFKFYADGSAAYYGPSGYAVPFVRLANGDYASPTALDATLKKNPAGTYTLTAHGDTVAQNFDANGRLTSIVDPNNNQLVFNYTANGASGNGYVLSSIVDTQGRTTSFTYNSSAQLTQITDPASRLYKYAYSPTNGSLITYTDPNNKVTKFGWTNGVLTSVTDPNNNVTSFTYNLTNQVTKITRGTSNWRYTYNTGNTVATDPDGHTQTYSFDGLGRVTKIVDGLGHTTFDSPGTGNLYNDDSQLLSFTNGLGGTSSFGYEANNESRNTSQIPTQAASHWKYQNPSFSFYPTQYTDPQSHSWDYSYDSHGNLLSQQETGQSPVTFTYNASNGTVATATNGNGQTTTYGYDTHGNLTTITPPAPLGQTTLTYDSLSRIATVKDGKNQTTTYTYDGLDRVTKITYNDNSTVTYVYDANGNLTSQADSNGTDTFTFDAQNRLTKETLPNLKTNTYTYDLAGNLATFADAGGTVTYNYDAANELSSLTDPNSKQTTFNYDNDHNRTQINYPNGVTQYTTYDNSNRITSIIGKKVAAGTVLTSFTYNYASGGVDTALRQSVTDNVAGTTTSYGYDYANRLASAVSPSSSYQYTYDADGNRLTAIVNGVTTNATYNNADELTQNGATTFASDADGNLLNTSSSLALTYNPKNQTTAAGSTSFNYLGAGQTQRVAAGSTSFQNNALGLGLQADSTGSTYFTRTPDDDLISERASAGTEYYLTDAIGSTIALVDALGNVTNTYKYEPYGKLVSSSGTAPNPFRFAGEYYDTSTQLYKIGARYYDPATGRWTTTDPLADAANTRATNPYSYASDDPINRVDPTGMKDGAGMGCLPGAHRGRPLSSSCLRLLRSYGICGQNKTLLALGAAFVAGGLALTGVGLAVDLGLLGAVSTEFGGLAAELSTEYGVSESSHLLIIQGAGSTGFGGYVVHRARRC